MSAESRRARQARKAAAQAEATESLMRFDGTSKRQAKHRERSRAITFKEDAGYISKGSVKWEPRGLKGHRYSKPRSAQSKVTSIRPVNKTETERYLSHLTQKDYD